MVQGESAEKKVHPFFSRNLDPPSTPPPGYAAAEKTGQPGLEDEDVSKKRKTEDGGEVQEDSAAKMPKRKRGRPRRSDAITKHLVQPQQTPEPAPAPADRLGQTEQQSPKTAPPTSEKSKQAAINDSAGKKVLKFNPLTGTLGSPPKPKCTSPPSRIVTIKYGKNAEDRAELGEKINAIMSTTQQSPEASSKRTRRRKANKTANTNMADISEPKVDSGAIKSTAKDTHPFFSGKSKEAIKPPVARQPVEAPKPEPPKRQTISMATPVSPRKQRLPFPSDHIRPPAFGSTRPAATKVPGAKHPAWPARDTTHVRGDQDLPSAKASAQGRHHNNSLSERKFKGQAVAISTDESVLCDTLRRLNLEDAKRTACFVDDDSSTPPRELRLPVQHFESGRQLQKRILPELRWLTPTSASADMDLDELGDGPHVKSHPIVTRLYAELAVSLCAYDRSTCEGSSWTQKYAPSSAAEVLQAGREAFYLKEWLEGLRVQAVETGNNDSGKVQAKGERPAKKRRKTKLDGFIVDSDDEEDDLDEVSDGEPDWTTSGSGRPKTVMRRVKKDQGRLNNAMVISGPHGSGKTASVYAVAKELGYEIFEINSSTRRSGKDILERVGDMTKNHLVHHQQDTGAEEDNVEDQVAKDLKSGKQGTMTAFFKAKPDAKAAKPRKAAKVVEQVSKPSSKSQKQSLILVEEADILYEEDKQFWQTLMSLMVQSKRPFVVTCNDEIAIPLQSLALHGILRFSMPPTELAVDVLLLIAANEGHALKRQAVEHLYMSRKYDLRATITELNYWCQIGVGDRRGGFDWFYQRWPKGIDVDEYGDTVRVISENTYMDAMGWLARDALATSGRALSKEEEALQQCWDSWRFAAGDWHEASGSDPSVFDLPSKDLDAFGNFSDALSAADISSTALGSAALEGSIDPGLPAMPDKVKEDFIIGRQLIEADTVTDYTLLNDGFATAQKSLARQVLYRHVASRAPDEAEALRPLDETDTTLALKRFFSTVCNDLTRLDLAYAFDSIAASDAHTATSHLDPSVFDRTTDLIVLDVAPWVRNIVAYDHALMQERKKLSSLLSEGGQSKRMRNTRAAYSALEGGDRKSTRREKYFQGSLNTLLVLKTGSDSWTRAATEQASHAESEAATPPSPTSTDVDE